LFVPRVTHITAIYLITGVCGLVDAACFLSMGHVFAETMTGNLLFLASSSAPDNRSLATRNTCS
jgi:uncharacterized membrane protein YoaK (UPF0700 family)